MKKRHIELLAPAGGLEQASAALAEGCDAVYGGLKNWGARNRAVNFTLEEYNEIIAECHECNAKFYLTINTLLTDKELSDIETLFSKENFMFPDAVIVADIGLMDMMHRKFPDIDIHASTQFGACSVEDVHFLEMLGVKRVVLARELSLKEIREIRRSTDMEIEVFTYGSQCVCFSGQCLWGGLVNGSSGNRGRCIGMCRDTYRAENGTLGQYMYPRDINLSSIAVKLSDIGIDSLKIEGRLRDSQEIASIVREFKAALDGEESLENKYSGWISGDYPVSGMFSAVNPRLKYSNEEAGSYGEHDVVYSALPVPSIHAGNTGNTDKYLFTSFSRPLERGNINISLKMKFKNRELKEIDFINTFGERKLLDAYSERTDQMSVKSAVEYIRNRIEYPVYELLSDVPENENVKINLNKLDDLIIQINKACSDENIYCAVSADFSDHNSEITGQTDLSSDIPLLRNKGIKCIIFELSTLSELCKVLSIDSGDIIYKLPMVDFNNRLPEMLEMLKGKRVMVSRASQVLLAEKYNFSEITADYTLNVWNNSAANLLKAYGVTGITAHPELSVVSSEQIAQTVGLQLSVVRKGKVPLGYMRGCWGECGACSKDCEGVFKLENITKGYGLTISCNSEFGFRRLWREGIDITENCAADTEKRYILTGLSEQERSELFNQTLNTNSICTVNVR